MSTFEEVLFALTLSPDERALLADKLLMSLQAPNQEEIDYAWAKEIEKRMRDLDEGRVEAIDGELVMRRLRSRRERSRFRKINPEDALYEVKR